MPIRYTDDPATPAALQDVPEDFVVFYSSRDEDGRLWCPDCRAVEDLVQRTFARADGPAALIVWVGQKPAYVSRGGPWDAPAQRWKSPSNAFRAQPWNVGSVPTVIRVADRARLVDDAIAQGLGSFVGAHDGDGASAGEVSC